MSDNLSIFDSPPTAEELQNARFFIPPTKEELDRAKPSPGQKALNAIQLVAKGVDSVTGAPARAAIYAAQEGKSPTNIIGAGLSQIGTSEGAPTGKMIVEKAGVPDTEFSVNPRNSASQLYQMLVSPETREKLSHITKSDVAGFGMDMAANPMNFIGGLKPAIGAARTIAEMGLAGRPGQLATKAMNAVGRGAAVVGETISGRPRTEIATYATRSPEVKALMKEAGGSVAKAADQVREGFQTALQKTRTSANAKISAAQEGASAKKTIPLSPILDELSQASAKINKKLYPEQIAQLKETVTRLRSVGSKAGNISEKDLNDVTQFLQSEGKSAYNFKGIFHAGSEAQKAAKGAAATSRVLRNENVPKIATPYEKLQALREIEKSPNAKNLLTPGSREAALLAAGSGENAKSAELLRRMSKLTGKDFTRQAENLAAGRTFYEPRLSPADGTGKSVWRSMAGGALGFLGSQVFHTDPWTSSAIGAFMTSPAALKTVIDLGRAGIYMLPNAAGVLEKVPQKVYNAAVMGAQGLEATRSGGAIGRKLERK